MLSSLSLPKNVHKVQRKNCFVLKPLKRSLERPALALMRSWRTCSVPLRRQVQMNSTCGFCRPVFKVGHQGAVCSREGVNRATFVRLFWKSFQRSSRVGGPAPPDHHWTRTPFKLISDTQQPHFFLKKPVNPTPQAINRECSISPLMINHKSNMQPLHGMPKFLRLMQKWRHLYHRYASCFQWHYENTAFLFKHISMCVNILTGGCQWRLLPLYHGWTFGSWPCIVFANLMSAFVACWHTGFHWWRVKHK